MLIITQLNKKDTDVLLRLDGKIIGVVRLFKHKGQHKIGIELPEEYKMEINTYEPIQSASKSTEEKHVRSSDEISKKC